MRRTSALKRSADLHAKHDQTCLKLLDGEEKLAHMFYEGLADDLNAEISKFFKKQNE